jgi:hypothetical protein
MKLPSIVLAALIFAGCYNPKFKDGIACDTGGSCPAGTTCGIDSICRATGMDGPDAGAGDGGMTDAPAAACEASTVVCDSRGHIVTCGDTGTVTSDVACPLGCASAGAACAQMEVSNGLTHFLTDAVGGADLEFPLGTSTITASNGKVSINNADVSVASEVINGIRVFALHSLKVKGQLLFTHEFNTPAIAFVVAGKVEIARLVDVSGTNVFPGPGALDTQAALTAGCAAGRGGHDNLIASKKGGGAGGGGYHSGAAGGSSASFAGGAPGASPFGNTLVPLRGGCEGGQSGSGFNGGGGGGAIQIVSATSIELTDLGAIDAGGGGGFGTPQQSGSDAGGGGGGGAILLEAPTITLTGASVVVAAKGAGGGGTGMNIDGTSVAIGEDGGTGAAAALGGFQASPGTFLRGGNGGTVDIAPTVGPSSATDVGAGGGGGTGQARFNTRDGTVTITGGAVVRAPLVLGTITLQTP